MITKTLDLAGYTGTENWYRHAINRAMTYTDGVKAMADQAGAYWLIDEIAITNMCEKKVSQEEFQVWNLKRKPESDGATLTCGDGNGNEVYRKEIDFTDFPEEQFAVWCTDHVILLPSEY